MRCRDERPHVGVGVHAVVDRERARSRGSASRPARRAMSPTATATEIAMQRSPAEP